MEIGLAEWAPWDMSCTLMLNRLGFHKICIILPNEQVWLWSTGLNDIHLPRYLVLPALLILNDARDELLRDFIVERVKAAVILILSDLADLLRTDLCLVPWVLQDWVMLRLLCLFWLLRKYFEVYQWSLLLSRPRAQILLLLCAASSYFLNEVNKVKLYLLVGARPIQAGVVHALMDNFCHVAMVDLSLWVLVAEVKHVLHYWLTEPRLVLGRLLGLLIFLLGKGYFRLVEEFSSCPSQTAAAPEFTSGLPLTSCVGKRYAPLLICRRRNFKHLLLDWIRRL